MKRHPALQDLSREHYNALKLARDGKVAAQGSDGAARAALAARVVREFADEIDAHFRFEEEHLLPFLQRSGETALVEKTLAEHAELRDLVDALHVGGAGASALQRFSELLATHVRFEERTLFETAQRCGFPEAG